MIKEENNDLKNLFIGIGVIFLYLILSSYVYDFLSIFKVNYNNLSATSKTIYLILYRLFLTLIIIFIYRKDFVPNLNDFKNNWVKYIKNYFKYWIIALILMLLSNFVITKFTISNTSINQKVIVEQFKLYPIYIFLTTVLISPILEELVYRLSFRKMFPKTNILFIVFSGIFFGMMHVIGTLTNLNDLLFIIPYSIPGFIFAYIYSKSDNICIPISLHIIHNLVMIIFQIIIILI